MDVHDFLYLLFCVLALSSGLTAKLCREEYIDSHKKSISGFWIFESEHFTRKGKKIRILLFILSSFSLIVFFAILLVQENIS